MISSNKKTIPILVLVLLLLSVWLYHSTISLFPSFIHAWTQSERYALSLGFLNNGLDFFHPCTYNLQTIDGITRVDFPINEYIVALIMKISGSTSPAIFRIYTLMISVIGLVYLYLLSKKITSSEIKSVTVVLFVFLSPIYVYYQAGFIPSVPAIAFVFIAYYYFFSYKESKRNKYFALGILFFLLAALIRIPFLIFLFAVVLQQSYLFLKQRKINWFEFFVICIAFVLFAGYYRYNVHLGRIYGNNFLDDFRPVRRWEDFKEVIKQMYHVWSWHYFTIAHYILLLITIVLSIYFFIKRKSFSEQNKKYWFNLLIIFCGSGMYFLLMSSQYYDHDYYFLDSFFVPVVLLFLFAINNLKIETNRQKISWSVCFFVLIITSVFYSDKKQRERYTTYDWDRVEVSRKNFTGTDKFLDSAGVSKDAKILVIDAYSTNIPLILMNRKGYTVYQTSRDNALIPLVKYPWDYVAIQDEFLISDVLKYYPIVSSMIERVMGTGKVSFYKRSKEIKNKSLSEFLSITPDKALFSAQLNFDEAIKDPIHILPTWKLSEQNYSSPNSAVLDSSVEYGATFQFKASEFSNTTNLKVLVSGKFFSTKIIDRIELVAAASNSTGTVFYEKYLLKEYLKPINKWQHSEFLFFLPSFKTKEDVLKIYLWNPKREKLLYDNLEIGIYK